MRTDTLSLNQGQQAIADRFFDFLFSNDREIAISGPGGYGKTYLMGYLIDKVMPQYFETCKLMGLAPEYDQVVMTATTNKASEVLSLSTGRPTETVHSFLNLKVTDDHATGKSKLTKTRNWMVHDRKIVFIDEASMMDGDLIQVLHEGTHKCKIVYVLDHCQLLSPIETSSPILRLGVPFYHLTEPMRNSGQPALMAVCSQLRATVETGVFQPIQLVPGVIDHVDGSEMERLIGQTFANQTRDARLLAYTNSRVIEYNEHIRELRNLPSEYGVGELLVNNQAIQLGTKKLTMSVETEVEIIEQSSKTEKLYIDKNAELEVRRSRLKTSLGVYHEYVQLPVDREHYAALLRYFSRRKEWSNFFALKNAVPDLRPRDAATIHKAQGSTLDTVFVDVGNLSSCNMPNTVARLLYVAFSRARSRVILYGDLAQKYGGLQA